MQKGTLCGCLRQFTVMERLLFPRLKTFSKFYPIGFHMAISLMMGLIYHFKNGIVT
jgi:hypothetical protein